MVEDVEENIVEKSVIVDILVKLQTAICGRVGRTLFVVEQAS
jgi:hypothetical protein